MLLASVFLMCLHVTGVHSFLKSSMTVVLNMYLYLLAALDISVNDPYEQHLKELFSYWYAQKVKECLDRGDAVKNICVDLKTSTIKPIHFHWLIENCSWLAEQDSALSCGWKEAGILKYSATNAMSVHAIMYVEP